MNASRLPDAIDIPIISDIKVDNGLRQPADEGYTTAAG
jgi:hypothetical protein